MVINDTQLDLDSIETRLTLVAYFGPVRLSLPLPQLAHSDSEGGDYPAPATFLDQLRWSR
jgi:hypothetical protein